MITSVPTRGLIYAGDTPLACSIAVEQTGPMQITVRAGSFTTTGQSTVLDYQPMLHNLAFMHGTVERIYSPARVCWPRFNADGHIVDVAATLYEPVLHDHLIKKGRVALVPARTRIRTWQVPPETFVLHEDKVFDIAQNAAYRIDLVAVGDVAYAILLSRAIAGSWPTLPEGMRPIYPLTQEFTTTTVLSDIEVVGILPGFPAATEPEDWVIQKGSTGEDHHAVVLRVQVKALERMLRRVSVLAPIRDRELIQVERKTSSLTA